MLVQAMVCLARGVRVMLGELLGEVLANQWMSIERRGTKISRMCVGE